MQFREGANVLTANREKIGEVDRVVLDPKTKEVTHLVAEKGFLFTEEKVIPMSLVGNATEEEVILSDNGIELDELLDYEESHYIAAEVEAHRQQTPKTTWVRPLYAYPPVVGMQTNDKGYAYGMPNYVKTISRNIPEDTVALEIGADMLSSDGEHIGDVERVFLDDQGERATHLLISDGLFGEKEETHSHRVGVQCG